MNPTMLDTPIWQLTPRQLFDLQDEYIKRSRPQEQPKQEPKRSGWVTLAEAADILDRAKASLYRYMQEWEKLGAVSKVGGVTQINIDIIRSNKQKQYKQTKRQF